MMGTNNLLVQEAAGLPKGSSVYDAETNTLWVQDFYKYMFSNIVDLGWDYVLDTCFWYADLKVTQLIANGYITITINFT